MTYVEAKQRLDDWYAGDDVDISPEVLVCCYNAIRKQIPKKVIRYSDDESDHVFCPCCNECIGSNEIIYDDFYLRGWSAMYCEECGQAMVWQ